MEIFPAIDLKNGEVVRLQYGELDKKTVFSTNPVETATEWMEQGARWLHMVNLDGAFDQPDEATVAAVAKIAQLPIKVQFGGGLRSIAAVEQAFSLGIDRVVIGTMALEKPDLLEQLVRQFGGERIVVSLDARDGIVQTRGWQKDSGLEILVAALKMKEIGIKTILHTDIGRDGVLTGVNAEASAVLAKESGLSIIASGGVATLEDVKHCVRPGIAGVIIGRALYERVFSVTDALAIIKEGN